jgi:hypothetical protein
MLVNVAANFALELFVFRKQKNILIKQHILILKNIASDLACLKE